MDCFRSAFRVSHPNKLSRNEVSDAEDAIWGVLRKAISGSSSSSSAFGAEEDHAAGRATSTLKRQRAAAFFMSFYVCGVKGSAGDEERRDGKAEFLLKVEVQREREQSEKSKDEKEVLQWWQESGKKRRKIGSEEWVAGEGNGNAMRRAPGRLKRLMRRVRAKVRKMGKVQKAASFHYDPLSYSMNFDDGCWQHCEAHAKLFYTSSSASSTSSCSSSSTGKLQGAS